MRSCRHPDRSLACAAPAKRVSSPAAASSTGLTARHSVFQVQPSCLARPWTDAFSRRICLIAHPVARAVSSALRGATSGSCSMNEVTEHAGSGHTHRRFRHHNLTGAPKLGASINSTRCCP